MQILFHLACLFIFVFFIAVETETRLSTFYLVILPMNLILCITARIYCNDTVIKNSSVSIEITFIVYSNYQWLRLQSVYRHVNKGVLSAVLDQRVFK